MTLPVSGAISLGQVNTELGVSATATRSLNDATTRTLFGKASGAISLSDGYGKSNEFAFTISANQTNANLRTLAISAGWDQSTKLVATVGSGVVISSTSTATPALTVSGSFPNGVSLINNGLIRGRGGNGGSGGSWSAGGAATNGAVGGTGGIALSVAVSVSVTNNNTIGGGGGGGGGGGAAQLYGSYYMGGGGGGGGAGISSGGSGGTVGLGTAYPGGVGGAGTISAAGSGGAGGQYSPPLYNAGPGGAGGGYGATGSTGGTTAAGYATAYTFGGAGGAAGAAVSGNANITWVATGTRLGPIT